MSSRRLLLFAAALLAAGCASSNVANLDSGDIARELRNRGLEPSGVVIPYEMTEEMRAWAHHLVPEETAEEKRLETLLAGIVDPDKLKVVYEPRYTATAQEVFETRRANCWLHQTIVAGAGGGSAPAFSRRGHSRGSEKGDLVVVSARERRTGRAPRSRSSLLGRAGARLRRARIFDLTAIAPLHSNRAASCCGRQEEEPAVVRRPWTSIRSAGRINYGWP